METGTLHRISEQEWRIEPRGKMLVPAVIYGSGTLVREMDEKVREQLENVASLPGTERAAYAMPDAHWGYGFPIGGVAAFDPERGGVVSAGGVRFDISCGLRTLLTGLRSEDVEAVKQTLANALFRHIPAGVGSRGKIELTDEELDAMLEDGAEWALRRGYGCGADPRRTEEHGRMEGANASAISVFAKNRQRREMGTLGSGNHYLEVQKVTEVYEEAAAAVFGLHVGDTVVSIHCGSRGLGHQIGTEYLDELAARGILIRSPSPRGVAEEAPGAYKNVSAVVEASEKAGLSKRVARLEPMICIKGLSGGAWLADGVHR